MAHYVVTQTCTYHIEADSEEDAMEDFLTCLIDEPDYVDTQVEQWI